MGQIFEPYDPDPAHVFPPSPKDWLPEGHLSYFVSETSGELDVSPFMSKHADRADGGDSVACHPSMLLKVLIDSCAVVLFSLRSIAAGLEDLIALRYLAGACRPSHRVMIHVRQEHIERFETILVDVAYVVKR